MTIFETIKADVLQARKDRDQTKVNVLNTLIAELCRETKEPNDDQVVKVVRKFLKNLDISMYAVAKAIHLTRESDLNTLSREYKIVSVYNKEDEAVDFHSVVDQLIDDNPGKSMGWYLGQTLKAVGGNPIAIKTYLESKI